MIPRLFLALGLSLASPAAAQEAEAEARFGAATVVPLLMRSTTDIAVMRPTLEAFVARNPDLAVDYEQWGSNALFDASRADCGGAAAADAVFSSAVHQMVDLVNTGCASPYRSLVTATLPAARIWRDELWGITHESAVIIYNTRLLAAREVPQSRFELLDLMRREDSRFRGRIATYDIEASGLGYLFAFADSLQASTFGALLEGFARTDAVATCCSAEIISGVSDGTYLLAYNVLGSYVDATRFRDVGVIRPRDYTLLLSRAYMIPKQARQKEAAARLLDFLLSADGQATLAGSGLVGRGEDGEAALTESTTRPIPIDPMLLVARDQHKRARFIERWRATFGG